MLGPAQVNAKSNTRLKDLRADIDTYDSIEVAPPQDQDVTATMSLTPSKNMPVDEQIGPFCGVADIAQSSKITDPVVQPLKSKSCKVAAHEVVSVVE